MGQGWEAGTSGGRDVGTWGRVDRKIVGKGLQGLGEPSERAAPRATPAVADTFESWEVRAARGSCAGWSDRAPRHRNTSPDGSAGTPDSRQSPGSSSAQFPRRVPPAGRVDLGKDSPSGRAVATSHDAPVHLRPPHAQSERPDRRRPPGSCSTVTCPWPPCHLWDRPPITIRRQP